MTAVTTIAENDDAQKAPKMRADQIYNDLLAAKDWPPLGYMYHWHQRVNLIKLNSHHWTLSQMFSILLA